MTGSVLRYLAVLALFAVGCAAPTGDVDTEEEGETESAQKGAPGQLDIGFNGPTDQFPFVDSFVANEKNKTRLCHTYITWKAADEPTGLPFGPNAAEPKDGTRAYFEYYLSKAEGHCNEVLLSFKALNPQAVPTAKAYAEAMDRFFAVPWKKNTGFTGRFAFTAWNEPNNKADDGNGLGNPIPPDVAAHYFLALASRCKKHDCTVAAGDFASNGNMWLAYDGKSGSYMDTYKNTIEKDAGGYPNLDAGFRPHAFALHGWHDVNVYIDNGNKAANTDTSVVRKLVASLNEKTWKGVEIWDTETGAGQKKAVNDDEQACAAAFLMQNHTVDGRITRMYLTRLHRGTTSLYGASPDAPRPAATLLQNRQTSAGRKCR